MTKETATPIELDYSAPPRPRRIKFKLKWLLFASAVVASIFSAGVEHSWNGGITGNSVGGTACGLWIAFALIHVQELKSQSPPQ